MDVKYQVFVSSTFEDLQDERRAVMQQILNMGHIPTGMELFQASDQAQWDYIKQRISASDYFFVILGERYGSIEPESGKSYTLKEYEYAVDSKIPVVAFLLSKDARAKRPRNLVEDGRGAEIEAFRKLVTNSRLCKHWSDSGELASHVGTALNELSQKGDRPGWVRSDSLLLANLRRDDPLSSLASIALRQSIDRDLEIAGYYRADQILEFEIVGVDDRINIVLTFESELIPVRGHARVYKPRIFPPEGVRLTKSDYWIGKGEVDDFKDISAKTHDRLRVVYEALDVDLKVLKDWHLWPCPVLNYTVKFKKSEQFRFAVGRLVGQRQPASIDEDDAGDCLVFAGKIAELTAQGLEWKLSRAVA